MRGRKEGSGLRQGPLPAAAAAAAACAATTTQSRTRDCRAQPAARGQGARLRMALVARRRIEALGANLLLPLLLPLVAGAGKPGCLIDQGIQKRGKRMD